jgi:hypothetical protein
MDFFKKMIGFMCLWERGIWRKGRNDIKDDLSMESKMYGCPYENDRFHVSLGAGDFGESQK